MDSYFVFCFYQTQDWFTYLSVSILLYQYLLHLDLKRWYTWDWNTEIYGNYYYNTLCNVHCAFIYGRVPLDLICYYQNENLCEYWRLKMWLLKINKCENCD